MRVESQELAGQVVDTAAFRVYDQGCKGIYRLHAGNGCRATRKEGRSNTQNYGYFTRGSPTFVQSLNLSGKRMRGVSGLWDFDRIFER
jgi:hypothetical protein